MTSFERNHTAKQYRAIRKILRGNAPYCKEQEIPQSTLLSKMAFVAFILGVMFIGSCQVVHAFTDEQYVNAIYKAEGGIHAKHPFGNSNAKCNTLQACKEICSRNLRNNKKRYQRYGFKRYPRFVQFLGNGYSPVARRNLSKSEIRSNKYAEVTESQAVKILVGEASSQGFKGMVCVAEVLRRKGSTHGFYGLRASHSAHEPKWVWNMAKKAWYASLHTNYTRLADHFENIHAFGCPYWIKNCVKTFSYRDHVFYREVNRA